MTHQPTVIENCKGLAPGGIRLSIGLEDWHDIIEISGGPGAKFSISNRHFILACIFYLHGWQELFVAAKTKVTGV
jgi:hypothetical protein